MDRIGQRPRGERGPIVIGASEPSTIDLDVFDLGRASAETRGCMGVFLDAVCELQLDGIDHD